MKYLLDTHVILWALSNDSRISKELKETLLNENNQVYYSTVSPWEVEIIHQKVESFTLTGKQLCFLCDQCDIINLPIQNKHIERLHEIEKIDDSIKHNGPFDKMLLAQALQEDMILITHDHKFKAYKQNNIMLI